MTKYTNLTVCCYSNSIKTLTELDLKDQHLTKGRCIVLGLDQFRLTPDITGTFTERQQVHVSGGKEL